MNEHSSDFLLSSYDYELPEERIAQYPPEERGASRLMILDRACGRNIHTTFSRLPDFLPDDALLVVNNSCVVPARLFGNKPSGGRAELLLLTPPPCSRLVRSERVTAGAERRPRCCCGLAAAYM